MSSAGNMDRGAALLAFLRQPMTFEEVNEVAEELYSDLNFEQWFDPPSSQNHFESLAPPKMPTYTRIYVRILEGNFPFKVYIPPVVKCFMVCYVSLDTNVDVHQPGALTPATNPGAMKPSQIEGWFSPGGAVRFPGSVGGGHHELLPQPAESMDAQSDGSNQSELDEDNYYALLEFRADPEASLMRRIKEKLGHMTKKQRNEIFKEYVERQRDEIERDMLRELKGRNARDAASMWETDVPAENDDAEKDKIKKDDAEKNDTKKHDEKYHFPKGTYGYVPAHPDLSERECWDEYHERFYNLTISERNKFVEAISYHGYQLALHVAWYANQQQERKKIKKVRDRPPFAFPPNPATTPGVADLKPHIALGFSVLPWGNHFMSAMHMATVVISTAKTLVTRMGEDAYEQGKMKTERVGDLPASMDQCLKDMTEANELRDELPGKLKEAGKIASEWLHNAIEWGVFDVDTEELTDYESMGDDSEDEAIAKIMADVEETKKKDDAEAERKKKKDEAKAEKEQKKKDKGKGKATEEDVERWEREDKEKAEAEGRAAATGTGAEGGDEADGEAESKAEEPKPKQKKKRNKGKKKGKMSAAAIAAGLAGLSTADSETADATALAEANVAAALAADEWIEEKGNDDGEKGPDLREGGRLPNHRFGVSGREGVYRKLP